MIPTHTVSFGAMAALLLLATPTLACTAEEDDKMKHEGKANRLVREKSVYLQQHAYNPVDWYPWGEEAFQKASDEDKPIFLSIGYSTCHWCHVMERESFEDDEVAAFLNEHFVSIKVDREERPDVDSIYMAFVQAQTGSGGWPLTAFLTPDRVPFFGGTYFPPEEVQGRPSFMRVLTSLKEAWDKNREQIVQQGEQVKKFLESTSKGMIQPGDLSYGMIEGAVAEYAASFDHAYGGRSGAPKFPAPMMLGLLLRHELKSGDQVALQMVTKTLDSMADGGIHDLIGGGFSRYSVDMRWHVPHFEKMLYGNGQLARLYAEAYQRTGTKRYRKVAEDILDYLLRDMLLEGGAFAAAEDADSEGEEGTFYTWTPDEVRAVLPEELAEVALAAYGVTDQGHLDGRSVIFAANTEGVDADRLERARQLLFEARAKRERPLRDDKILAGWNGLAISAFAFCGRAFDQKRYLEAAQAAAGFVLDNQYKEGVLIRRFRDGEARFAGQLKDYAYFTQGLLDLYEADFDRRWLDAAIALTDAMVEVFGDPESGTFFDVPAGDEHLLIRPRSATDGALPSGTAVACKNLLRVAELRMDAEMRERAERCMKAYGTVMNSSPVAFTELLIAVTMFLEPPREVVFAGIPGSDQLESLVRTYYKDFQPFRVIAFADADPAVREADQKVLELLLGKVPVDGKAAVYLCENYSCKAPVTDPKRLSLP